jgi:hypothetical protein
MLRELLDQEERPKPDPFRPLRYYRRREAHRCFMRFAYRIHGRQHCR